MAPACTCEAVVVGIVETPIWHHGDIIRRGDLRVVEGADVFHFSLAQFSGARGDGEDFDGGVAADGFLVEEFVGGGEGGLGVDEVELDFGGVGGVATAG